VASFLILVEPDRLLSIESVASLLKKALGFQPLGPSGVSLGAAHRRLLGWLPSRKTQRVLVKPVAKNPDFMRLSARFRTKMTESGAILHKKDASKRARFQTSV